MDDPSGSTGLTTQCSTPISSPQTTIKVRIEISNFGVGFELFSPPPDILNTAPSAWGDAPLKGDPGSLPKVAWSSCPPAFCFHAGQSGLCKAAETAADPSDLWLCLSSVSCEWVLAWLDFLLLYEKKLNLWPKKRQEGSYAVLQMY